MLNPKTPGVYIVEQNAFPDSVGEVDTAIPVFIGYTQQASYKGKNLAKIPTKVESFKQSEDFFGAGFQQIFDLVSTAPAAGTGSISGGSITTATLGGGTLAGGTPPASGASVITKATVADADATALDITRATITKGTAAGGHFTSGLIGNGATIAGGSLTLPAPSSSSPADLTFAPSQGFQLAPQGSTFYLHNALQLFYLNGGSTCYIVSIGDYNAKPNPDDFINSGISPLEAEQDPTMLLCPDVLMLPRQDYAKVIQQMLLHCKTVKKRVALFDVYGDKGTGTGTAASLPPGPDDIEPFRENVRTEALNYGIAYYPWVNASVVSFTDVSFLNLTPSVLNALAGLPVTAAAIKPQFTAAASKLSAAPAGSATLDAANLAIHNSLLAGSPEYGLTLRTITNHLNVQPVAPAMTGVITRVDSSRGVWKAPANVSLNAVISPNVLVSDLDQESLNVDAMTGKSINVIRSFKGLGTLVWGARTLDGNSQDWRYINVRRTMIMIEQSIKLAARNTVFEPNDANTWTTFKSMLTSFLFNLWKQGALAGTKPDDAYQVLVGLGSTMTANDILDGIMNVTVLVALVRPAEFIVVTFKQQMQVS